MPEVFDSMCRAVALKEQDLNAQVLGNALWAMATSFRAVAEVFNSMWQAAAP